jgi:hypothetical protein
MVGQFFGPAAARRAVASLTVLKGARQYNGTMPLSAGRSQFLHSVSTGTSQGGTLHFVLETCQVKPNPSLKPSPNGGPPGPAHRYAVHFLCAGPGVPPLGPA